MAATIDVKRCVRRERCGGAVQSGGPRSVAYMIPTTTTRGQGIKRGLIDAHDEIGVADLVARHSNFAYSRQGEER